MITFVPFVKNNDFIIDTITSNNTHDARAAAAIRSIVSIASTRGEHEPTPAGVNGLLTYPLSLMD